MKVGDLVDFHTNAWVFKGAERRYSNPGLVLRIARPTGKNRVVADIYWSDGKITREYDSYLRPAEGK